MVKEDLEEDKDEGASVEDDSSVPEDREVNLASDKEAVEGDDNNRKAVNKENNKGEAVEREDNNRKTVEKEDNKGKAVEREDNNRKAVEREDNNEAVVEREDIKGETVGDREEENEVKIYLNYRAGNSLICFPSKSLVFCPKMSE